MEGSLSDLLNVKLKPLYLLSKMKIPKGGMVQGDPQQHVYCVKKLYYDYESIVFLTIYFEVGSTVQPHGIDS